MSDLVESQTPKEKNVIFMLTAILLNSFNNDDIFRECLNVLLQQCKADTVLVREFLTQKLKCFNK